MFILLKKFQCFTVSVCVCVILCNMKYNPMLLIRLTTLCFLINAVQKLTTLRLFHTAINTHLVNTHNNKVNVSICGEIREHPMLETKVPQLCIVVV
jgi:hypothetical protein